MANISRKQSLRRKMIVEKATELMNETGYANLTVRMICDAADISTGTFYHYFSSKSELVIELFALIDDYFKDKVLPGLNNADELQNIVEFCRGFAEYVTLVGVERSKLINSMFPPYSNRGKHEERKRVLFAELHRIIRRGQEKGQITTDYMAEQLTDMIIVIIRGYCFDWSRREGPYNLVEHTVEVISLFLESLKTGRPGSS